MSKSGSLEGELLFCRIGVLRQVNFDKSEIKPARNLTNQATLGSLDRLAKVTEKNVAEIYCSIWIDAKHWSDDFAQ